MTSKNIEVVVAIDFGTIFSGYAYAHKANPKEITVENKWGGSRDYKVPTIIKYKDESYSTIKSWGFDALLERPPRRKEDVDRSKPIELFKLFLFKDKSSLRDKLDYKKVITDYLKNLGRMIKEKVKEIWKIADFYFYSQVLIVLTIPVEFDDNAIAIMRECAFNAELTNEEDSRYLIFVTEPEAAAVHCLNSEENILNNLRPGDSFIVADCGGGTVNLTSLELLANKRISEITESTSGSCGSSFIDRNFKEFLRRKLGNSTIELLEKDHYNVLQYMIQKFGKDVKIPFTGEKSDFQRYEIVLKDYPSFKKQGSKIVLKDYPWIGDIIEKAKEQGLLKESDCSIYVEFDDVIRMFDPLVGRILHLIEGQLAQQRNKKCSAIVLVGGFSESKYLRARVRKEFGNIVSVPMEPMLAVVRGGVQYGLQVETIVNRVLKRTYGTDIVRRCLPGDPPSEILPDGYTIVFDALSRRGDRISVNDKVIRKFKPQSKMQRSVSFDLYVTEKSDAKYCNDPGVSLLHSWEIELPENNNYEDITISLTLTFGTVEILATAENQKTGKKYRVKVKYE